MMQRFVPTALAALLLASCGSDTAPIAGERTNILTVATPKAAGIAPQLTAARRNSSWTHASGNAQALMGALSLPDAVSKRWSTNIGTVRDQYGLGAVAAPVVANNKVYVLNARAQVSAVAADTGALLWQADLTPEGEDARAGNGGGLALSDNALIATTGFGTISLINTADGKVQASAKLDRPVRAAPVTDGNIILVRTVDDRLVFLDAQTLRIVRTMRTPPVVGAGYPYAHAALSSSVAAIPLSSGEVILLGQLNGQQQSLMRSLQPTGALALRGTGYVAVQTPTIDTDAIYATAEGGQTAAWSRQTGAVLWQQSIASVVPLQKVGNAVFGVTASGDVFALRQNDGQLLYSKTLPAARKNTPARAVSLLATGNKLVILTAQGQLVFVSASDGAVQQTLEAPKNALPMAIANGVLYIVGDGALTAWY